MRKHEEIKEKDYSLLEFTKQGSKTKRRFKSLALLLFNILVIAIIVIIELTSNRERVSINTVLATWGKNWSYLLMLLALLALYYLCLTAKLSLLIKATTGRSRWKLAFSTAVLGKYYDNITPYGSGGQPFMMFNLGRKLDVGLSTSIPIADFIVNQLVFTVMAIVIFIINPGVMANSLLRYAAYVGVFFYAFLPIVVIAFSVFPGAITAIAKFFCRVGHKIRLIKDLEKAENKATSGVQRYSSSLKTVGEKWRYLVLSAIVAALAWWILTSFPYIVMRVSDVDANYFDTVCMCFFVYAAITVIPTPGNAGAAEGAFYAIFKSLSGGFLFWGTMLWRFCVYYFSLISGFAVTVYQYVHASRKEKRAVLATSRRAHALVEAGEQATPDLLTDKSEVKQVTLDCTVDTSESDLATPDSSALNELPTQQQGASETDSFEEKL